MIYHFEKFGFESANLGSVTDYLSGALNMEFEYRFSDSFGGDISRSGKRGILGGRLVLFENQNGDISGQFLNEEDFPELGLILWIEQQGEYVDYELKLKEMKTFKPKLLYRSRYESETKKKEVIFDLAKERSQKKS